MSETSIVPVPLVEAAIEVRFPGDARVETWRGEFQHRVREEFPQLFVPMQKLEDFTRGDALALKPYRFSNQSNTRALSLALNSFAYQVQDYPGWPSFLHEALCHWSELSSAIAPGVLTRVGVRYVNIFDKRMIKSVRRSSPAAYMRVLRDNPVVHNSVSLFDRGAAKLLVRVERQQAENRLVLDYDCFQEGLRPSELERALNVLHNEIEGEFRSILTPSYSRQLVSTESGDN